MNNIVYLADYRDSQHPKPPVNPAYVALSVAVWGGGVALGLFIMWSALKAFLAAWGS